MTFRERLPEPRARQWAKFVAASLVGLIANVGCYVLLTTQFDIFDRHRLLALLVGVGLGGGVSFLLTTLYVYRRHRAPTLEPEPGGGGRTQVKRP